MEINKPIKIQVKPYGFPEWDRKVRENFTVVEIYDATKGLPEQKKDFIENGIPCSEFILNVAQTVRNYTGYPVYIGSAYRSPEWEKYKGRNGQSRHVQKEAVDLSGQNVINSVYNSLQSQGELYQQLKQIGVTRFGFYSWGVHLDCKPNSGADVVWYDDSFKKKIHLIPYPIGYPLS